MLHQRLAVTLFLITVSCRDAPTGVHARGDPVIPVSEYARQLHGDPFLRSIADALRRPDISTQLDEAIALLHDRSEIGSAKWSALLAPSYVSARAASNAGADTTQGSLEAAREAEVLAATLDLTVDRLANVRASEEIVSEARTSPSTASSGKRARP